MTDELDPQTQQHIDHSEDAVDDCDTPTCVDASTDAPATADAHAGADKATDTDDTVEHDESEQPEPSDAEPDTDPAPQAAGPIEVSSEEELDAVMDSMMDAVKAMKDAVADADIDAEEEEAAEAASTFVPGETPVADQGSTMPSFLQLEHPTIGADAVDPHAAGFSVVEGGTGNIAAPQAADADAVDTARPIAPHSPDANRDLGTAVSNTANAVGTFIAQGASAMREMNAAKKALADARAHLAELEQRIVDQAEELETRQDIAGRYDQIVADQRQAIATAQKTAAAAEIDRDAHAAKATELKSQLEQMKTEDDATELRLKARSTPWRPARQARARPATASFDVLRIPSASATRCRPSETPALPPHNKPSTPRAPSSRRCVMSMPSCNAIPRQIPPTIRCAPASSRCRSPTRQMPCVKPKKMSRASPPTLSTRLPQPSRPSSRLKPPLPKPNARTKP